MVHQPVLMAEALEALDLRPGLRIVDCTTGNAGHAKEFLARVLPGGSLIGFDRDPEMANRGRQALEQAGFRPDNDFRVLVRRFSTLEEGLETTGWSRCDRIFADIGVCSLHFDDANRGFSLKRDGPLDMRMNPHDGGPSAADLVNTASEAELTRIIREFGEERFAARIAKAICTQRREDPIQTTLALREVVAKAIPRKAWPDDIDVATRTFQGLRIAVNDELGELEALLEAIPRVLEPGGIAAIITFHSLESRMVKNAFRELARPTKIAPEKLVFQSFGESEFELITRKAIFATAEEAESNPRARSASLRAIRRKVS